MRRWIGPKTVISNQFCYFPTKHFGTNNNNKPTAATSSSDGGVRKYDETYRQLDKLDFMTAAKILFNSPPPKNKKFGCNDNLFTGKPPSLFAWNVIQSLLDFHLVQFFFACMPSLAVYLVAQYSRYEMRKMEAELEKKKKIDEEAKAKEDELKASEEKENNPIPDLSEVKVRLDKLEEAVKEIVVESKKQLDETSTKSPKYATEKKDDDATINRNMEAKSKANNLKTEDQKIEQKSEKLAPSSGQIDGNG